jgi:hypothetical protein
VPAARAATERRASGHRARGGARALEAVVRNPKVDEWFAGYDNPLKEVLLHMRQAILGADGRIEETIKWKSPTFMYKGNIASFNPRAKRHASLMFHTGASIPGEFPHLEGSGDVARYLNVDGLEQAKALEHELVAIFRAWCDMKDGEGGAR